MIAQDQPGDDSEVEKASTTIAVRPSTKARLDELKPFDSMSYDEAVQLLLDGHDESGD